jgi:two-component system chemotaxis response regulator CheY
MARILLVDDSVVIRKMLRRVLGDCKLTIDEVMEAGDGSQALAVLAAGPVDLVLCDVNMPVMGGLEFLENVQQHAEWSKIPVVMVTTEGAQDSVLRAVKLGAKGYIRKPFTHDEVKQKLTELLAPAVA